MTTSIVTATVTGVRCGNCTTGRGRDVKIVRHASAAAVRLCFARRYNPGRVTDEQRATAAAVRSQAEMDADDAAMNAMVQAGERRQDAQAAADKWARDLSVAFVPPTQG